MQVLKIIESAFKLKFIFVLIFLVGCSSKYTELADEIRAKSIWQSTKLTHESVHNKSVPSSWDAAAFLSLPTISSALSTLKETEVINKSEGDFKEWKVAIDDLALSTKTGYTEASLEVSVFDENGDERGKLNVTTLLVLEDIKRNKQDQSVIYFSLKPVKVSPKLTFSLFSVKLPKNISELIADVIEVKKGSSLRFPIAINDKLEYKISSQKETIEFKNDKDKKIGSAILQTNMGITKVSQYLNIARPVFIDQGIWLAMSIDPSPSSGVTLPKIPDVSLDELKKQTSIMAREIDLALSKSDSSNKKTSIFINQKSFLKVSNFINSLSEKDRTITVKSIKTTGKVTETEWHDDVLGKGGTYVKLNGDKAVNIKATVGNTSSNWVAGKGLLINAPIKVDAEVSIHAHIDPLIGGGVGTTVGMLGGTSHDSQVSLSFEKETINGSSAFVLKPNMRCEAIDLKIVTDGRLKFPGGWASMPKIGATIKQLIGDKPLEWSPLMTDIPTYIPLDFDNSPENDISITHLAKYISVNTDLVEMKVTGQGVYIDVDISFGTENKDEVVARAVEELTRFNEAMIAKSNAQNISCPDTNKVLVHLGALEIGPNNELVKLLKAAGKLTEEVIKELKRLGGEVSADKIDGWIKNPADSIRRGEVGRTLEKIGIKL